MSWPGENDPPTSGGSAGASGSSGSSGRGRRRRADSPPEDPYAASRNSTGTGRRGSGEYERPAEYVARAEQEAAAYDQYSGYGYQQQPQYPADQYQQDPYQQDPYQQGGYQYGNSAYPEAQGQYRNLDSSGFYQPAYQPQEAPQQPSYEYDPYGQAPPQATPSYEQQAPSYDQPAPSRISAFPTRPEPVAGFMPDFEPTAPPRAVTTETEAEAASDDDDTGGAEASERDLTNWLQFVGNDDRRAERARRRRIQLISLATVLVLLVVGGAWFLFGRSSGVKATETTVLFQVKDTNGNAVGSVVLVADKNEVAGKSDPSGRGAAVLVPAELSVESAALDSQPFGGSMPSAAPAGKDALTTLLGVDVDGVWSMDELTFAALLNNLIGVSVNVDPASAAAVVDGNTGKPIFQAGAQDMSGDKAAYYAVYHPKGEAPDKQLARFGQVVQGMLAKIPHTASTTTAVLNSLAAVPDPALPNDKLAAILTALGAEEQSDRFTEQSLPVRSDGSGVMDLDKASGVVKTLLGGAVKAKDNGGLTRVSVADGTGRQDTLSSRAMAESKLVGNGYTPVDQGVVQQTANTYVMVPSGATSLGNQVALALGLPDSAVRVSAFDTTLTDARVVLGADWTQIGQVPADQATTPSDTGTGTANGSVTGPASGTSSSAVGPTERTKGSTGHTSHRATSTASATG